MKCKNPLVANKSHVGCGQCNPCRINKTREWQCRLMLESYFHESSVFTTLTYNDLYVPYVPETALGLLEDLRPDDMVKMIKRLRYHHGALRHFTVGEYGDESQRPHYHQILFGVDPQSIEHMVERAWCDRNQSEIIQCIPTNLPPMGFTSVSEFTPERAAYVAGYCVKKLNHNHKDLEGRHPEYARMSRTPPLGASKEALDYLQAISEGRSGAEYISQTADVFLSIRIEGRILPLGNTVRKHLRARLGIPQLAEERKFHFDQTGKGKKEFEPNYKYDLAWWEDKKHYRHDIVNKTSPRALYEQIKAERIELPEIIEIAEYKEAKAKKDVLRSGRSKI